jgi:hypothetical protein
VESTDADAEIETRKMDTGGWGGLVGRRDRERLVNRYKVMIGQRNSFKVEYS